VEFSTYFRYLYVHDTCTVSFFYLETFIWWYFFTKGYMNVWEHCDKGTFSSSQYNYSREPNTIQGLVQNLCGGGGEITSAQKVCPPVIFPVDFFFPNCELPKFTENRPNRGFSVITRKISISQYPLRMVLSRRSCWAWTGFYYYS